MLIRQPSGNPQSITFARRMGSARQDATPYGAQPTDCARDPQALGKTLESAFQAAKALGDALATRLGDARKDNARQKVAQIRQEIDTLKKIMRMIMLFGGKVSESLLRQLRELARSLSEAASVLKEGAAESSPFVGVSDAANYSATDAMPSATAEDNARDGSDGATPMADAGSGTRQPEEVTALARNEPTARYPTREEEKNGKADTGSEQPVRALVAAPDNRRETERRSDAELIKEALRELKALVAMAKAARHKDHDSDKLLKDITKHLRQVDEAAGAMSIPSPTMPVAVGISVRV